MLVFVCGCVEGIAAAVGGAQARDLLVGASMRQPIRALEAH